MSRLMLQLTATGCNEIRSATLCTRFQVFTPKSTAKHPPTTREALRTLIRSRLRNRRRRRRRPQGSHRPRRLRRPRRPRPPRSPQSHLHTTGRWLRGRGGGSGRSPPAWSRVRAADRPNHRLVGLSPRGDTGPPRRGKSSHRHGGQEARCRTLPPRPRLPPRRWAARTSPRCMSAESPAIGWTSSRSLRCCRRRSGSALGSARCWSGGTGGAPGSRRFRGTRSARNRRSGPTLRVGPTSPQENWRGDRVLGGRPLCPYRLLLRCRCRRCQRCRCHRGLSEETRPQPPRHTFGDQAPPAHPPQYERPRVCTEVRRDFRPLLGPDGLRTPRRCMAGLRLSSPACIHPGMPEDSLLG
mmetsp:Transcript_60263/g.189430  ORF Transcript_60263/g.189430 Transcript_60263/m.189430 type:complete len:354 (+) Transcript_60263:32-1093(+)